MTYNFDPDKWYDNELLLLNSKLIKNEISKDQYEKRLDELDKKLEEMWKRLDGSYQINQK